MRKPTIIAMLSLSGLISSLSWAEEVVLQDNPPQHYTVVKGDTLWSISSRFLKSPWQWPELWKMNKDDIRNPHRIYPGDTVILDMSSGSPRLRLGSAGTGDGGIVKLFPMVRSESLDATAIPAIPPSVIGPFLSHPLVISQGDQSASAYIVGSEDSRIVMGLGDRVYADNVTPGSDTRLWNIYRPGKMLQDPDTQEILGHEAEYVGDAKTIAFSNPVTVEITRSVMEIRRNDNIVPANSKQLFQYVPRAPETEIKGQIISAYGAVSDAGPFATVVINKGSKDGLEEGHVLAVYQKGRIVKPEPGKPMENDWRYADKACIKDGEKLSFDQFYDPKNKLEPCEKKKPEPRQEVRYSDIGCLKPGARISFDQFFNPKDVYKLHCRPETRSNEVTLPDSRTGLVFVYRVFDRVSYALIMNANRPVHLLDVVKNP
ncbi:MAG: LysM domain-containing protein [Sulfuricellaceae bacterium]|nr:LysM domain-containing protein [Sulfuricellaceae bacterium]